MIPTPEPVAARRRLAAWALALTASATACAVSMPPSGGPEDKTPPSVAEVVPARDSSGVAAEAKIRISFSEDMTRRGIERLLEFSPPVVIDAVDWDGRTVVITPRGGLHPDTTYIVTLNAGAADNHRVASKNPYVFAFATSAGIDTGRVAGTVRFRREPTNKGVVHCYALRDTVFVPEATRPDRRAKVGEGGAYELGYLGTDHRRYLIWAFEDQNGDGLFAPDQDVGHAAYDTVTLSATAPFATGVDFAIVDPNEPAVVSGKVVNESGIDTLSVSVGLYAQGDTVPPAYYTLCDTTGRYDFGSVRAGVYLLKAFVDVVRDSLCGDYPCGPDSTLVCAEPCVTHPDSVRVEPGDVRKMTPIELGGVSP